MGVLKIVDKLRSSLAKQKSKWTHKSNSDAFYFYYALRSIEMILDKMEEHFKNAVKVGDNPNIAKDSLMVMQPMRDLLDAVEVDHISEKTIDVVLERTDDLLTVATDTNLRESIETSRAMIDKDLLKSKYTKLKRNILQHA